MTRPGTPMTPAVSAVALAVAAALSVGAAHAQTAAPAADQAAQADQPQLQEVVVTAERRSTDVQKTADSISVRTGAALTDQGKYSISQIIEDVPGVTYNPVGAVGAGGSDEQGSKLIIRGIQSNVGAGGSITSVAPATAVYVDGVYEGVGGDYDIDRVEVLRGPQGTLYGRSATAGLMAVHTTDPNLARIGGTASAEFGNYSLQHYTAALNLPIIDEELGVRVSGNRYQRDGYYSSEGGKTDTTDGRVKVLYKPNEDFSLLLGAALQNNSLGAGGVSYYLQGPNSYRIAPTGLGHGANQYRQYWALLNWNLGFATLSYQPAFRSWNSSNTSSLFIPGLAAYSSADATPKDHFHTEELRLASNPGSKLTWQLGGLYYFNDLNNVAALSPVPQAISGFATQGGYYSTTPEQSTQAAGVFGEATYPITPSTRFTGGLRYDYNRVATNETYSVYTAYVLQPPAFLGGEAGVREFHNITYKARLEQDLTPRNMLYASVSTGTSPGSVTTASGPGSLPNTTVPTILDLRAETLTAYELGSKNRFLENRLQVNGDVYYYFYGGYQSAGINLTPNSLTPAAATLLSQAEVFGAELESIYQLTPNDTIGFNAAYTNAYWVNKNHEFTSLSNGTTVSFAQYFTTNGIPGIAPFTPSLSWDHSINFGNGQKLTLRGDVRYSSPYDGSNLAQGVVTAANNYYAYNRVGGQTIGDLNATWAYNNYSVTGYVRNVGDNEYKTSLGYNVGTWSAAPYDPRTYGVVLSARW